MNMTKIVFAVGLLLAGSIVVRAQDSAAARALTLEEYEKAKPFSVGDSDKHTYG